MTLLMEGNTDGKRHENRFRPLDAAKPADRQLGSYGGYHVFRPSMDDAMPVTLLARERIGQIHARRRADLAALPIRHPLQ